jgi:hypothetical protein
MEHEWKIGDWCQPNGSDDRYLVYLVKANLIGLIDGEGNTRYGSGHSYTHLPDCTGWDWQPPKPQPKTRPMTRDEFLAAWKQRGFCPLINSEDDYDIVTQVVIDDCDDDQEIVQLYGEGWCSLCELSNYKFASDNSPLTVEE